MKKIIFVLMVLTVFTSANYEIFVTKTGQGSGGKSEVIYFGEYKNFLEESAKIKKYVAAKGVEGALTGLQGASAQLAQGLLTDGMQAGLSGAGIGVVIGMLDPIVMDLWADQMWYLLKKRVDGKGKVSFVKILLVCDKHPSLSEDKAKQIMMSKGN